MNPFAEAIKGITDLPIAGICLILGILCRKKNRAWSALFLLIGISAVLGAVAHIFALPQVASNGIWIVLYALLYECVRRFASLYCAYLTGEKPTVHPVIRVTEFVLYLLSGILLLAVGKYDIYVFAAFACICLIQVVICFVKVRKPNKNAVALLALLFPPLIFQLLAAVVPYAIVWEHICIVLTLMIAYCVACDSGKNTDGKA